MLSLWSLLTADDLRLCFLQRSWVCTKIGYNPPERMKNHEILGYPIFIPTQNNGNHGLRSTILRGKGSKIRQSMVIEAGKNPHLCAICSGCRKLEAVSGLENATPK